MHLVMIGPEVRTRAMAAYAAVSSNTRVTFTSDGASLGEEHLRILSSEFPPTEARLFGIGPDEMAAGDAFVIALPARSIPEVVSARRLDLSGKPLLLAPGGFGGVLRVRQLFEDWGLTPPIVVETTGWLGSGKIETAGALRITARKRNLPVAGLADTDTNEAARVFNQFWPDFVTSDLVTTSLSNINTIGHPAIAIANATRMENGEPYELWRAGYSRAVSNLMEAIDLERVAVVDALGGDSASLLEWMHRLYGEEGFNGPSLDEALSTFEYYQDGGNLGPASLDDRFLSDDVPFGVAAFEALAKELKLPHRVLSAVRTIAETYLQRSLHSEDAIVSAFLAYAGSRASS